MVTATYRLQLHAGFTFTNALAQVPYLADLGVSHLYLSPVLQAVPGSMHGYDVIDHTKISADLGGEDALVALAGTARDRGLGLVVDIVPNHMAFVAPESANAPLWQVLREGRDAPTAHWFDIDWKAGGGRIGLPILGRPLPEVLDAGEITLDRRSEGENADQPVLRYFDHVLPVALGTESEDVAEVLTRQHYQLADWRDTDSMLNYRRFFDVDQLIAIRVELPDVFEATHRQLLDLNHRGVIDGFRIDHPDGLADPVGYLERLRASTRPGTLIWVEKILGGRERLPEIWACDGTTGYDAMQAIAAALVDPAALDVLDRTWQNAGGELDLHSTEQVAKRTVVADLLGPELQRLTRRARESLPDADPNRLEEAITELLVAGEVYRAYVRPERKLTLLARKRLDDAFSQARAARPDLSSELAQLVELAMAEDNDEASADDFAVRLQQTWGPVMAKGIEDTTFYRWHRLVALNEVGGDPGCIEQAGPQALHDWARAQAEHWPRGMTTLSTHDTKRSEDVRARLLAVAGDTDSWQECSDTFATAADEHDVDRPMAHFLWQTLIGVGPINAERLYGYLTKAMREAKQHTQWVNGDDAYEARVVALADKARAPGPLKTVLERAVVRNQEPIRATVLAQKLLQLTMPGAPDTYQGCELVDLHLVDPDNRGEVDYPARVRRLAGLGSDDSDDSDDSDHPAHLVDLDDEKLLVTARALAVRQRLAGCFDASGGYVALDCDTEHALGFVRGGKVMTVVTRAPHRLTTSGGWTDQTISLPGGTWCDQFGNGVFGPGPVLLADLFARLPVALLVADDA